MLFITTTILFQNYIYWVWLLIYLKIPILY